MWDHQPTPDELLRHRVASGWVPTPSRLKDGDQILGHAACAFGSGQQVLAESLWRKSFGAAPDIIGQTVNLDGVVHTVVGVMPPTFLSLEASQFWKVLDLRPGDLTQVGGGPFDAVARLTTADIEVARRQAKTVSAGLRPTHAASSNRVYPH